MDSNKANSRLIAKWTLEMKDILIHKIALFCNVTVTDSKAFCLKNPPSPTHSYGLGFQRLVRRGQREEGQLQALFARRSSKNVLAGARELMILRLYIMIADSVDETPPADKWRFHTGRFSHDPAHTSPVPYIHTVDERGA